MKLNTKKLFESSSSIKTTPKSKLKFPHKYKYSSPFLNANQTINNKSNTNSNIKQKLFQTSNKKVNPFIYSSEKSQESKIYKTRRKSKMKTIQYNIENLEKNDLFEDSDNNIRLTNESDNNDNNQNIVNTIENDKKNEKQNQKDEIGEFNLFQKNALKSTIIVDNNGNNNLDLEQKKIIEDYFKKKSIKNKPLQNNFKRGIRKIPTQIYKNKTSFFNRIYGNIEKASNIRKNNANNTTKKISILKGLKLKNEYIKIKENLLEVKANLTGNKMKSYDINHFFFMVDDKNNIQKEKIVKNEYVDNNSLFENENENNLSFNSSFLGSSLDDDFYKNLNKN